MQETEDVHPSSAATKKNSNTCHSNEEEKGENQSTHTNANSEDDTNVTSWRETFRSLPIKLKPINYRAEA